MAKTRMEKAIIDWDRKQWGPGRSIDKKEKLIEEIGELLLALEAYEHQPCAEWRKNLADEAGDVVICLTALLGRAGLSLQRSTEIKWAEVLDRTNGIGRPVKP